MIALLACSGGYCLAFEKEYRLKKEPRNQHSTEAVVKTLATFDQAMVTSPPEVVVEEVFERLAGMSFEGIVVSAPSRLDFSRQNRFPVLVAIEQNGESIQRDSLAESAVMVGIHLETGDWWAGPMSARAGRRRPASAPKEGSGGAVNPISPPRSPFRMQAVASPDIRSLLDLPVRKGYYVVRVVSRDKVSNTQVTRVKQMEANPQVSDSGRRVRQLPATWPMATDEAEVLPNFARTEHTPLVFGNGVALAMPETVFGYGKTIPVHGAISLSEENSWVKRLVRNNQLEKNGGAAADKPVAPSGSGPFAAIPGVLIVTREGDTESLIMPLQIPINITRNVQSIRDFSGNFAYDLNILNGANLQAGKYYAHLMVGGYLSSAPAFEVKKLEPQMDTDTHG